MSLLDDVLASAVPSAHKLASVFSLHNAKDERDGSARNYERLSFKDEPSSIGRLIMQHDFGHILQFASTDKLHRLLLPNFGFVAGFSGGRKAARLGTGKVEAEATFLTGRLFPNDRDHIWLIRNTIAVHAYGKDITTDERTTIVEQAHESVARMDIDELVDKVYAFAVDNVDRAK